MVTSSYSTSFGDPFFLDVDFNSLCDLKVVGFITCERVVLGKGSKVLISGSAQGICPPYRGR